MKAARRPEVSEIGVYGGGAPAEQEPHNYQARECACLRGGENVLDDLSILQPAAVRPRKKNDSQNRHELCRRERQRVAARNVHGRDQVAVFRHTRREDAEEAREGHSHCGDGAGLDNGEKRPAIQESPQR